MSGSPSVVVNKGGFFSALVKGFFGLLITAVICGTVLGVYTLNTLSGDVGRLLGSAEQIACRTIEILPQWQEAMPPIIAESLDDRRAIDYREFIDIQTRKVEHHDGTTFFVVDIYNRGEETVTALPLRILVLDADGVPLRESNTYAATPLMIDEEWNGPLLPGDDPRTVSVVMRGYQNYTLDRASVEIVDLRIANPPADDANHDVHDEHEHADDHPDADQQRV
jgi:hypothetical protein